MAKAKYKLLKKDNITFAEHKLYRIKALVNINTKYKLVKAGDLGGYIQSTANLSQNGNCWVFNDAKVYDNATVDENALIFNNAQIYDEAIVTGEASIWDNAQIYDEARVGGNVSVYGNVQIYDEAQVYRGAVISDNAKICDSATVSGRASVYGSARIGGESFIKGDATIRDAQVFGNVCICNDATIIDSVQLNSKDSYICLGPIGSRHDTLTAYMGNDCVKVHIGCFTGTLEQFVEKVSKTHKDTVYEKQYLKAVEMIKLSLNINIKQD